MRRLFTIIVVAVMALCSAHEASAKFHFGVKGGIALNSLSANLADYKISSDNGVGYTVGAMGEIDLPLTGLCVDVSLLWARRKVGSSDQNLTRDYLDLPVHLKYKIGIPPITNFVQPFICTGPDAAFLLGAGDGFNIDNLSRFSFMWNVGFGLELFRHFQIQAQYGIAIKALNKTSDGVPPVKDRLWTITAAFVF